MSEKKTEKQEKKKKPTVRSPLVVVKEKFGDKAKLVEAVKAFTTDDLWVGRLASDRGGDKGLDHVSNAKLLKLHATFTEVKSKFGTRDKLIGEILVLEKRVKDDGFKKRISALLNATMRIRGFKRTINTHFYDIGQVLREVVHAVPLNARPMPSMRSTTNSQPGGP